MRTIRTIPQPGRKATLCSRMFWPCNTIRSHTTHANCRLLSRRDKATMAHNTRKCSPGRPGCNFNLIARYFGRAYAYACKVRKGEALLNAFGLHAIPHFASTLTSCSSRLAWSVSSCEVEKDRGRPRKIGWLPVCLGNHTIADLALLTAMRLDSAMVK